MFGNAGFLQKCLFHDCALHDGKSMMSHRHKYLDVLVLRGTTFTSTAYSGQSTINPIKFFHCCQIGRLNKNNHFNFLEEQRLNAVI